MNDQQLRTLVRDVMAGRGGVFAGESDRPPAAPAVRLHASHGMFTLHAGADTDDRCLIEPAVMCNHCGYCKSMGH